MLFLHPRRQRSSNHIAKALGDKPLIHGNIGTYGKPSRPYHLNFTSVPARTGAVSG